MKNTKLLLAGIAVAFIAVFASAAQNVSIDMRYNVEKSEPAKDFFKWTLGNKTVNDTFDVATGASKLKSTHEFDAVRFDSAATKKATLPVTLRGLLLYPVSPRSVADGDNLHVVANGKELTIRFVHRDTAFQLKTDATGKIDIATAGLSAVVGENVAGKFVLKAEFVKAGGDKTKMSDLDWNKVPLAKDAAVADATRKYTGVLTAVYAKGILTIKGSLTETK